MRFKQENRKKQQRMQKAGKLILTTALLTMFVAVAAAQIPPDTTPLTENCGSNEFLNGNGNCVTDTDTDTDNQNLDDVLTQGNTATGHNIYLDNGGNKINLNSGDGALEISRSSSNAYIDLKNDTGEDYDIRLQRTAENTLSLEGGNLYLNGNAITNADWSNANDLNSGGGISDFSNANDLDSSGNIADFSAANDLDGSGNLGSGTVSDNEISDNTVDSSEIQNGAGFTFGSVTSNGDVSISGPTESQISAGPFTSSTKQNTISLSSSGSSNDPGYITHETNDNRTNTGVLHLAPSDDNAFGDYVAIHGTDDPASLKFHTDGSIEGITSLNNCGANEALLGDGTCGSTSSAHNKDLVAGNALTGGANDVLVGTDSDVTIDVASGSIADNEISDNTVDNSEIQNSDRFSFQNFNERYSWDISSGSGSYTVKLGEIRRRNFGGKISVIRSTDQGNSEVSHQDVYISKRGDNSKAIGVLRGVEGQLVEIIVTDTNNDANGDGYNDSYVYASCADYCSTDITMKKSTGGFIREKTSGVSLTGTKSFESSQDIGYRQTPSGGIDMNGNSITNIGGLQSCGSNEFVNGNGNCETDTDTDTDNQNLAEVLSQGNTARSSTAIVDRFYADDHGIGGTPGISLAVGDTDTGLHSDTDGRLEFWTNSGERFSLTNSELKSQGADLNMNGNGITGAGYVKTNYLYANSGNDLVLQNDGGSPVLRINSGANKVTMKGDIDMSGNVINNVDKFSTSRIPNIEPIYIKGTGLNNNANRVVEIGGTQVVSNSCRGLQLVVVQKSDHSVTQNTCYDTFGTASDSDNLEGNLTNLGNGEIGILTSYDAWEDSVDSGLDDAFKSRGLYKAYSTPNSGSRRPYAAIFEGASSTGNAAKATEVLFTDDGSHPQAEIRGFLVDGSFMAEGSKQSNLAGNQGKDIAISTDSSQNVEVPNGNLDVRNNQAQFTDSGRTSFIQTNNGGRDLRVVGAQEIHLEASQHVQVEGGFQLPTGADAY